jgi:hypothetical protein
MGCRRVRGPAEDDAFTGWRHVLCYVQRPGVRSGIKRAARRRDRHAAKREVRGERELWTLGR